MEPIVSREAIRALARKAAALDRAVQEANPYPEHSAAHRHFEGDFWACVSEIESSKAEV
jgi:hypothetical protein